MKSRVKSSAESLALTTCAWGDHSNPTAGYLRVQGTNARDVATFVKNILSHILNRVRHGYSVNPTSNYPFRMDAKQSDQCDRAEIEPQPAAASVVARYV